MDWLGRAFGLSPFDLDLVLVALGPHVDLKYERIYSYLQDDVTRRRPSVDLALNLLCTSPGEKLERRAHFAAQAPLLRHGLIRLSAEPHQVDPPLLALAIGLDEQVVDVLTGQGGLDRRLVPFCRRIVPSGSDTWPVEDRRLDAAQGLIVRARRRGTAATAVLPGRPRDGPAPGCRATWRPPPAPRSWPRISPKPRSGAYGARLVARGLAPRRGAVPRMHRRPAQQRAGLDGAGRGHRGERMRRDPGRHPAMAGRRIGARARTAGGADGPIRSARRPGVRCVVVRRAGGDGAKP